MFFQSENLFRSLKFVDEFIEWFVHLHFQMYSNWGENFSFLNFLKDLLDDLIEQMCASFMFNTNPSIMNSHMNFEPPITSNHLLSPTSPFGSPQSNQQLIDQTALNCNLNSQLLFNPNSRSPTYGMPDDMKNDYKKKAKHCLVCGEPAYVFFFVLLLCSWWLIVAFVKLTNKQKNI